MKSPYSLKPSLDSNIDHKPLTNKKLEDSIKKLKDEKKNSSSLEVHLL